MLSPAHSPVHFDPELKKALDELGPLRFAVAPNRYHHPSVGDVSSAYRDARLRRGYHWLLEDRACYSTSSAG